MKIFLKIVLFSLLVVSLYALFAVKYIPPLTPAPPPQEEALDLGAMTMEQFVALGDKIFNGKGTCTLCHNPVVKRAPLLDTIAATVNDRLKDSRYKGKAKDSAEYIEESMREPSAYVVAGYGVTGTNDTQSPMPDVTKGAIGLNGVEVKAVVAYMQSIAGVEITVEIPKGGAIEEKKEGAQAAPAKTPQEVVSKYGCGACHKIVGEQGEIGPDLTRIGAKKNFEYLTRAVMEPNADIAQGFMPDMMPADYKDKMTAGELQLIVNHMAKSK